MHEVSLASGMIGCLVELAEKEHMNAIEKVTVQIGVLSGVMPEALVFAFEALVEGGEREASVLKGCQLMIERVPARGRCKSCLEVSQITHENKRCLYCGSNDLEIISGYELQISEVEGEDAEGAD